MYAKLSVAQNGAVPQVRAGAKVNASLVVRNIGTATANDVDLTMTLPSQFIYEGKNAVISTSTAWIIAGDDFVSQTGSAITYPRLWRIGNRPNGDVGVMNVPLITLANARPGTYEIPVVARIPNARSNEPEAKGTLKIIVTGASAGIAPRPVVRTAPKQIASVAKPKAAAPQPKAPEKICITVDEYQRLLAASTTASSLDNLTVTKPNVLAALGDIFDLGTGSPCFGLIILLLIILAIAIAIRLIFHYMDSESDDDTPSNQTPLIR